MAGRLVRDGDDLCFVPRFAFVEGTTYTVSSVVSSAAVLVRPRPERPATTEVLGDPPDRDRRCPATCSGSTSCSRRPCARAAPPGTSGSSTMHGRRAIVGALLPTEHELWDPTAAA